MASAGLAVSTAAAAAAANTPADVTLGLSCTAALNEWVRLLFDALTAVPCPVFRAWSTGPEWVSRPAVGHAPGAHVRVVLGTTMVSGAARMSYVDR
ncbi:hypothetical protein AS200_02170 [Streptomyces sp. CdTB01]|nr:hypothetical protein AS200_02170 [Streptomyces sp. CdTB01]